MPHHIAAVGDDTGVRNIISMFGVMFERHGGASGCGRDLSLRRSGRRRQPRPIRVLDGASRRQIEVKLG
jgi:hypothetical protein